MLPLRVAAMAWKTSKTAAMVTKLQQGMHQQVAQRRQHAVAEHLWDAWDLRQRGWRAIVSASTVGWEEEGEDEGGGGSLASDASRLRVASSRWAMVLDGVVCMCVCQGAWSIGSHRVESNTRCFGASLHVPLLEHRTLLHVHHLVTCTTYAHNTGATSARVTANYTTV